jgi:hypothetical protein
MAARAKIVAAAQLMIVAVLTLSQHINEEGRYARPI